MKFRRAVGAAVLAYLLSLIAGLLIAIFAGINVAEMSAPPARLWMVTAVLAIAMTWLAASRYFRSTKVMKGSVYGLYLGLYMLVVGFVLDILGRIPAYVQTQTFDALRAYYSMPMFWITVLIIVVVCILVGQRSAKKL